MSLTTKQMQEILRKQDARLSDSLEKLLRDRYAEIRGHPDWPKPKLRLSRWRRFVEWFGRSIWG